MFGLITKKSRLLHKLGIHTWKYNRDFDCSDISFCHFPILPSNDSNHECRKRECIYCGYKEYWSPDKQHWILEQTNKINYDNIYKVRCLDEKVKP